MLSRAVLGSVLLLALSACEDNSGSSTDTVIGAGAGGAPQAGVPGGAAAAGAGAGASAGVGGAQQPAAGTGAPPQAGTSAGAAAPASDASTEPPDAGGTADAAVDPTTSVIVPTASWTCGLPEGIPPAQGELVLEADLELGQPLELGQTQYGARTVFPIDGGAFTGPQIDGNVMAGGLDWQLTLPSGAVEVESRLVLQTGNGARVYLRVCGVAAGDAVRIVPDFEASSSGAYAFLNAGTLVGTREVDGAAMRLAVYRVAAPPADAPRVMTPAESDAALPRQVWDCGGPAAPANTADQVLQAPVQIGAILSIGQSKYGSRTIIPITGGSFSGPQLAGDVIPGGADFQLTPPGGSLEIEARYTLRTDDGELISVRNCGGGGGTTPLFETRPDGPYGFLTEERFSGTIGLAVGGVLITVYRAR